MLLESLFGDLGKQYKLPTSLNRQLSRLAFQGLNARDLNEVLLAHPIGFATQQLNDTPRTVISSERQWSM